MDIGGIVAAGAGLLGATTVAIRYYLGRDMSKNPTLTISLTEEQYELIRIWAGRSDLSIQEYAAKTLVESVPAVEVTASKDAQMVESALERAFGLLDRAEALSTPPGVFPLPPARKPIPGVLSEAERTHPMQRVTKTSTMALPTVPPGPHPCMHLSGPIPAHLRGQCQGLCAHREQEGRICYWTPTTATNCSYFEGKANHPRAGRR